MSLLKQYKDFKEFQKKRVETIGKARGDAPVIAVSYLREIDNKKIYESVTFINGNEVIASFDKKTRRGFIMVDGVAL